jgi:23S rRNA (uracil1939-C5)-methyltransferase
VTVVRIRGIAAGGDGVGQLADGMTVFVPRTAPGDDVAVEITQRRRRHAKGRAVELRAPGPGRASPACVHYTRDACGGCQLQHLDAAAQLAAKQSLVGEALRRIGRRDVPDPAIIPSPAAWRYRTKITLTVSPDGARIGLRQVDRPDAVFDLVDCPITDERLMDLWSAVRAHRPLLPPDLRDVVLRIDRDGRAHVIARSNPPAWDAAPLAAAVGRADVSYWWHAEGGAARVVAGPVTGFPALAFEQANPVLADAIRAAAVTALAPSPGVKIWDLYGGVGDGARRLAEAGAAVWSVEADRSAVEWAARQPASSAPTYVQGLVEHVLPRLPRPQAVLLNPPRTGAHARVTEALERLAREPAGGLRVAYVSCDPATLARDLARLPSYVVRQVVAYDLFPQTSHVETLVVLEAM